jgi:hypothetical protein
MGYKDFSRDQYIKTFDTGEEVGIGSFQVVENGELRHIRPAVYINGTLSGNEQIRANIYSERTLESKIASSEWASFSEIETLSTYWIGLIRLDYDFIPLNKNIKYYHTLELQNYTRNEDVFYIGIPYDFPFPVYDNGQDKFFEHPLQTEIFQFRELQN